MSSLKTLHLAHLPPECLIHIAVFQEVKNATFLQQQLLQGNTAFEYAFIDTSVIAESFRRFGISPSTTSLLAIKVSTDSSVDVASVQHHLSESVEGTSIAFEDECIAKFTDMARIRKIYKLPSSAARGTERGSKKRSVQGEREDKDTHVDAQDSIAERKKMEAVVLGAMALRGAT
ncbi:MAG: hypothetical protein Q9174_002613 [Haloplaca sp. 1 TL-2023]